MKKIILLCAIAFSSFSSLAAQAAGPVGNYAFTPKEGFKDDCRAIGFVGIFHFALEGENYGKMTFLSTGRTHGLFRDRRSANAFATMIMGDRFQQDSRLDFSNSTFRYTRSEGMSSFSCDGTFVRK